MDKTNFFLSVVFVNRFFPRRVEFIFYAIGTVTGVKI